MVHILLNMITCKNGHIAIFSHEADQTRDGLTLFLKKAIALSLQELNSAATERTLLRSLIHRVAISWK